MLDKSKREFIQCTNNLNNIIEKYYQNICNDKNVLKALKEFLESNDNLVEDLKLSGYKVNQREDYKDSICTLSRNMFFFIKDKNLGTYKK